MLKGPGRTAAPVFVSVKYFFMIISLWQFMASSFLSAEPSLQFSVLILHSYHQGYSWTDSIHAGLYETLSEGALLTEGDSLEFHVEYMDTKRHPETGDLDSLEYLYRRKYTARGKTFNVIIATDDDALDFLLERKERLFPGAPVVFCGANDIDPLLITEFHGITGVNEAISVRETLNLALDLRPKANVIGVVGDTTTAGRRNVELLRMIKKEYSDRYDFIYLAELEPEELREGLSLLGPDDICLYLSYLSAPSGKTFTLEQSVGLVTGASSAPVFGCWDFLVGLGAVGGKVVHGYFQGEKAGELALRILRGERPDDIPFVMESPNAYLVDYKIMRKYQMNRRDLPEGTVIINEPDSFLDRYWPWLAGGLFFILFQMALISYLFLARKRLLSSERKLREHEENLRTTLHSIGDGVIAVDIDGCVARMNRAAEELTGWTPMDAFGRPIGEVFRIIDQQTRIKSPDPVEQVMKTGSVVELSNHTLLISKDEREYHIADSAAPILDDSGKISGVVVVFRDATEKYRAQEALIRSEKLSSIAGLAAGLAHEINNPLSTILQNAQLLTSRLVEDNEHNTRAALEAGTSFGSIKRYAELRGVIEALGFICSQGKRTSVLIKNMLSFSRDDSSVFEFCHIPDIFEDIISVMAGNYSLKERFDSELMDIHKEFEVQMPRVYCCRSRMEQLFFNLLKNSIEAADSEKHTVITLRVFQESGSAVIHVEDNGPGINFPDRIKPFEPFFTTKNPGEGSGLGLFISYNIVREHHGGDINIETPQGGGTRMVVRLPFDFRRMGV